MKDAIRLLLDLVMFFVGFLLAVGIFKGVVWLVYVVLGLVFVRYALFPMFVRMDKKGGGV